MHHGNDRTACRRQPREIGEGAPAGNEHFRLTHQVGAGAFDHLHERQFVFERQRLRPERLVDAHGRRRAALDAAVRRRDDASDARNESDARHAAAAGDVGVAVVVMHLVAAQRRDFEKRRAAVEDKRQPLARQQLPPRLEFGLRPRRGFDDLAFKRAKTVDQFQMIGAVLRIAFAARVDFTFKDRH